MTPVTQNNPNGSSALNNSWVQSQLCPHFPPRGCSLSWVFSGSREASCLNQAPHPAAQTSGKPFSRLQERLIKWPGFKNLTQSRWVTAGFCMSEQKPPSPELGGTACASLNLRCVLQCSALLPWQKAPHSNNLFQRRLKRDSAHAQKCCTCSLSSLQRPFQRNHHKDKRKIRYWYFFLC